ncbi:N-acetyltransferase NAT13, partial [Ceratobasidium sp. AG-I]
MTAATATMPPTPVNAPAASAMPVVNRSRPVARVSLASLTPNNLGTLRKLNSVLFPIRYSEKFYKEVLEPELEEFCKLIYYNDIPVGAVCSRIEKGRGPEEACVYVMTMGVLAPYRSLGLGSTALQHLTSTFNPSKRKITSFYLHVHVPNTEARTFYERYGFVERDRIVGYYRKLGSTDGAERDAWVLERPVK